MTGNPLRKVDLHVHTAFSSFRHLKPLRARDSYNDPQASRLLLSDGR